MKVKVKVPYCFFKVLVCELHIIHWMEGSNNSTVKLSFHVKLWHCEEVTLTHQKALISKDAFKRGDLVKSLPHLCFEPMRCPLKKRGTNLRGKFTLFLLILQVCREWNWFKSNLTTTEFVSWIISSIIS